MLPSAAVLDSPVTLLAPAWVVAGMVLLDGAASSLRADALFAPWPAAWMLVVAAACTAVVWCLGRADQARTSRSPDSE